MQKRSRTVLYNIRLQNLRGHLQLNTAVLRAYMQFDSPDKKSCNDELVRENYRKFRSDLQNEIDICKTQSTGVLDETQDKLITYAQEVEMIQPVEVATKTNGTTEAKPEENPAVEKPIEKPVNEEKPSVVDVDENPEEPSVASPNSISNADKPIGRSADAELVQLQRNINETRGVLKTLGKSHQNCVRKILNKAEIAERKKFAEILCKQGKQGTQTQQPVQQGIQESGQQFAQQSAQQSIQY